MRLAIFFLFAVLAAAQGGTPFDCSGSATFSASKDLLIPNSAVSHPCVAWRVTFSSTGSLNSTLTFQTSPDNVTFTAVPNVQCSGATQLDCWTDGANPLAGTANGTAAFRTYAGYVRVHIVVNSGSGTGTATVYGYKGTSASANTGAGGSSVSITASSPLVATPSPIVGAGVLSCPECFALGTLVASKAKCDGVTDDTATIQGELVLLYGTGGSLILRAGICITDLASVTITASNVRLIGQGTRATVLQTSDATRDIAKVTGAGAGNCTPGDVFFSGFQSLQMRRTAAAVTGNGITVTKGCFTQIIGVDVGDSIKNIEDISSANTRVTNTLAQWSAGASGATRYGYYADTVTNSPYLTGFTVVGTGGGHQTATFFSGNGTADKFIDKIETASTDIAIQIETGVQNVRISNVTLDNCGATCVIIHNSFGRNINTMSIQGGWINTAGVGIDINVSVNILLTNLMFTNSNPGAATAGLVVRGGSAIVSVTGCTFVDLPIGIDVQAGSLLNRATDNTFWNTSAPRAATSDINVAAGSLKNDFSHNQFVGFYGKGLNFAAGANDNVAKDNTFDLTNAPIMIANAGTGNRFGDGPEAGAPSLNVTGCSGATLGTGSTNLAGTITNLPAGACTIIVTFGVTIPKTGWSCGVEDQTTAIAVAANLFRQSASNQTTATFSGVSLAADTLIYRCSEITN